LYLRQCITDVLWYLSFRLKIDAAYLSRHVALRSHVPIATPANTINRLCGSGFQAVITAAQEIQLGEASIALVGGTESMSQAPYALRNARNGTKYGVE
jgi:acetyl-CoA acyltransferase 2